MLAKCYISRGELEHQYLRGQCRARLDMCIRAQTDSQLVAFCPDLAASDCLPRLSKLILGTRAVSLASLLEPIISFLPFPCVLFGVLTKHEQALLWQSLST